MKQQEANQMAVFIGQFDPATRLPTCTYCGKVSDGAALRNGYAHEVCADCDTRNSFSDLQKDEYGSRPDLSRWTPREMRAWMDARRVLA